MATIILNDENIKAIQNGDIIKAIVFGHTIGIVGPSFVDKPNNTSEEKER